MLRVGVDATSLLLTPTGVGVFTGEVIAGLGRRATSQQVALSAYAVSWRGRHDLGALVGPDVTVVTRPMAARPLRVAWRHSDLPPIEWWTGPLDVVHGTNFVVPPTRRAAAVVTVHDLTPVHFPELSTPDTLQYPTLVRRAARRGAWVHTPSAFVAEEVRDWLGPDIDPEQVVTVANGVTPMAGGVPGRGRIRAGLGEDARYVLALGTIEPRKDLPTLVTAFDRMVGVGTTVDDAPWLVLAGPDGWGVEALEAALSRAGHADRVRRLGWVSAADRADLLAGAAVVAYPSVYEGFGLIPLEAMSAGVPVVCSSAGPLPEVVGDAAVLVAPRDPDALASALTRVLTDADTTARLVAAGRHRVEGFSWDRCVDGLLGVYRRASAVVG